MDGAITFKVRFDAEGVTETIELIQLGPRLFRIASVPVMAEAAGYADVIEADADSSGELRFRRVAGKGGWRTYSFVLHQEVVESERIIAVQKRVLSLGGHWERIFGGVLVLCLPPESDYDPTSDIRQVSK